MSDVKASVGQKYIYLNTPYKYKDICKSVEGRRWDPHKKMWKYPISPFLAEEIRRKFFEEDPTLDFESDEEFDNLVKKSLEIKKNQHIKEQSEENLEPVPNTKLPAWEHQLQAYNFAKELPSAMLAMDMGEQPLDELVLTKEGFRKMGSLKIGEKVIGSDGGETEIIDILEFENRPLWKVYFDDGAIVECSPTHLWVVSSTNKEVVTTTETIKNSLNKKIWERLNKVKKTKPVQFDKKNLEFDPYLFGVLLGDGSFKRCCAYSGRSSVRLTTSNKKILNKIKNKIPEKINLDTDEDGIHHHFRPNSEARKLVHSLNLCGLGSKEKFIPKKYLMSSIENRWELYKGMMDTDGLKNGLYYSTTSKKLAEDFSFLVRSLGGTGKINKYGIEYRINTGFNKKRKVARKIIKIEDTKKSVPMRCIKVANNDGLYLTRDFVVTHNTGKTKVTIDLIVNRGHKKTIIVCPSSVVDVWPDEFEKHAGEPVKVISLREGSVKERKEKADLEMKKAEANDIPIALVINYEAVWREPFASWAKKQDFDLMVADEIHRIKSPGGKQSRYCYQLGKKIPYKIGLTGTPMPHSPLDIYAQYRFLDPGVFGTSYNRFKNRYAIMGGFKNYQVMGYQNKDELYNRFDMIAYSCDSEDVQDLPEKVFIRKTTTLSDKAYKTYKELENEFYTEVEGQQITALNVLTKLLRLQQITGGYLPDDEGKVHKIDDNKRKLLADVLEDIDSKEPLVIFARFHNDMNEIANVCDKAGLSWCELSGRINQLKDFQRGDYDVIIVQIKSGGVGVDLTRARYALYYSIGHSLGDYQQSLKRVHRPGQDRTTYFIHLVVEGTVDVKVEKALVNKKEIIDEVLQKGE